MGHIGAQLLLPSAAATIVSAPTCEGRGDEAAGPLPLGLSGALEGEQLGAGRAQASGDEGDHAQEAGGPGGYTTVFTLPAMGGRSHGVCGEAGRAAWRAVGEEAGRGGQVKYQGLGGEAKWTQR